ncbi:MAG: hypothetical protein AAFX87_22745 [Bacteroidota bacterium]
MGRLTVKLNDLTVMKGFERKQEIYFVIFGYDPNGKAGDHKINFKDGDAQKEAENLFNPIMPGYENLKKWYFSQMTPIVKVKKKLKKTFFGGVVLFDGKVSDLTSFYLAILDSDGKSRDVGDKLENVFKNLGDGDDSLLKAILEGNPQAALLEKGFNFISGTVVDILQKNKDDVKYTGIFTFDKNDDFSVGEHEIVDFKVKFNFEVDYDED